MSWSHFSPLFALWCSHQVLFTTYLNALSCCPAVGWLAICVHKQLDILSSAWLCSQRALEHMKTFPGGSPGRNVHTVHACKKNVKLLQLNTCWGLTQRGGKHLGCCHNTGDHRPLMITAGKQNAAVSGDKQFLLRQGFDLTWAHRLLA